MLTARRMLERARRSCGEPSATNPAPDGRDEGVTAVIVAITMSALLLTMAGFTLDFGQTFVQQERTQTLADEAARSGAAWLPDTTAALAAVANVLCAAQTCPSSTQLDWLQDGDLVNGEVTLSAGDTTLTVRAPQRQVPLHFLRTGSSLPVNREATARIAAPLGRGVLPFALLRSELHYLGTPDGVSGQFCSRSVQPTYDPLPTGEAPASTGVGLTMTQPSSTSLPWDSQKLIQVRLPFAASLVENPQIVLGGVAYPATPSSGYPRRLEISAPLYLPGATQVWVTGTYYGAPMVTSALPLTYASATSSPCHSPAAGRRYLDLARTDDTAATTEAERLNANIAHGLTQSLVRNTDPDGACTSTATTSDCVTVSAEPLPDTTSGWFGPDGRMTHQCSAATTDVDGVTVDDTRVFLWESPLIERNHDGISVRAAIEIGQRTYLDEVWFTSRVFDCPRFGVVPIIDTGSSVPPGRGSYPITDFAYLWIEGPTPERGLERTSGQITTIRGYILRPEYLPPLAGRSAHVAPYDTAATIPELDSQPHQGTVVLSAPQATSSAPTP